jgi:peptidoglycan/xylan/chitin deacetylase (PgdA/CDA1 family)
MTYSYKAYLTIDDSPSDITDELIDFLHERDIPALIFCRGDYLEANPGPIIRAIEKGFVIGNHLYSHQRSSTLPMQAICDEIDRTEQLIEKAYKDADTLQPIKTIRFPYIDRGMGAWFVVPSNISNDQERDIFERLIETGLGNNLSAIPDKDQITKKNQLQNFLKTRGYVVPKFDACSLNWFRNNSDMKTAHDTLITCSSSDWMLTARHLGKWPYPSIDDLQNAIMADFKDEPQSAQIFLLHDQTELKRTFINLIDALHANGVEFLHIE